MPAVPRVWSCIGVLTPLVACGVPADAAMGTSPWAATSSTGSTGPAGTSDGATGGAQTSGGSGTGSTTGFEAGTAGETDPFKFDLGTELDVPPACGDGRSVAFSNLWVGNSGNGTVSKIDTVQAVEVARYLSGPLDGETNAQPSRTAVNLAGDVAVANRLHNSVIKIAARQEDCIDYDGDGQITTSTGPMDVLPWGEDECVLWALDLEPFIQPTGYEIKPGARVAAWTPGTPTRSRCDAPDDAELWVAWAHDPTNTAYVRRLDGQTGEMNEQVEIPDWNHGLGLSTHFGPYGGASTADGDLWIIARPTNEVVFVDYESLEVSRYANPLASTGRHYGVALDADGNPWIAGFNSGELWKFDAMTESFELMATLDDVTHRRGLAIDGNGHAWIAGHNTGCSGGGCCNLARFDTTTATVIDAGIELPDCSSPVGVSIDFEGHVWVVDRGYNTAYKVDPDSYDVSLVGGLDSPYTYSDMTGAGLDLVVHPAG